MSATCNAPSDVSASWRELKKGERRDVFNRRFERRTACCLDWRFVRAPTPTRCSPSIKVQYAHRRRCAQRSSKFSILARSRPAGDPVGVQWRRKNSSRRTARSRRLHTHTASAAPSRDAAVENDCHFKLPHPAQARSHFPRISSTFPFHNSKAPVQEDKGSYHTAKQKCRRSQAAPSAALPSSLRPPAMAVAHWPRARRPSCRRATYGAAGACTLLGSRPPCRSSSSSTQRAQSSAWPALPW